MRETADAVIVGAGAIGTAVALELSRKGLRTVSVDRNPASGYGPTGASCAIVRVHYSTLDGTALAWEGYHLWRNWEDYLSEKPAEGAAKFRETGCLVMQTEQNRHLAAHVGHCKDLGIPCEIWDGKQILDRLPIYSLNSFSPVRRMEDEQFGRPNGGQLSGGVFWETAGYVTDPQLSARNMQFAAETASAKFIFGRKVTEIRRRAGRVSGIGLDDGTGIEAPVVINVAGPASSCVNAMADVCGDMALTTKALKQEVAHVPSPDGFDFHADGLVVSDSDIGCYVRPEAGNCILIGSEDPPCDPREFVDPEDWDRNFTDQWTVQVQRYAQRVPSLGIPGKARGTVELYDVTEDWIPIYDRSALPGFYMAIGTSGNQFKNAPVVGMIMAELVEYCEAGNDHDRQPLEFTLPATGRRIDIGFYSRKRTINAESSFSVLG